MTTPAGELRPNSVPCGPRVHLDLVHVEHREALEDRVFLDDVVVHQRHRLRGIEVEVGVAEAADVEARERAAERGLDVEAGQAPDSRRTSSPPEVSTSSFSPCTAVIAIGTSWMSSVRRCAVTCTVSSVLGACAVASARWPARWSARRPRWIARRRRPSAAAGRWRRQADASRTGGSWSCGSPGERALRPVARCCRTMTAAANHGGPNPDRIGTRCRRQA